MTAQILATELGNIIQEARKKSEIKHEAEISLQKLKALPITSEHQIAADLRRRPHFLKPILLACKTRQTKLIAPAVSCLQRLVSINGLAKECVKDVLVAFQDCHVVGPDVGLKILQCLPSLVQNDSIAIEGDLQATILEVCNALQQVKNSALSRTASATFQQLLSSLFEKLDNEDVKATDTPPVADVLIENNIIHLSVVAFDAYRVLDDLCLLTEGLKPQFIRNAALSRTFALELIETVLTSHAGVFKSHLEQAHLLRCRVLPLITRLISEPSSFAVTIRTARVFCILLREHLEIVQPDCGPALKLLNRLLDADTSIPWRRAVVMEVLRIVFSTPNLVVNIYTVLDQDDTKHAIIESILANFVRLAAEKPGLIGIGTQPTSLSKQLQPGTSAQEQAVLEAESVAGVIGGDIRMSDTEVPGISAERSSMKVPCLDQLDKIEAPVVPDTYIYSIVLTCMNNLSEGLTKYVLPLTAYKQGNSGVETSEIYENPEDADQEVSADPASNPNNSIEVTGEKRKHRGISVPINPLTLENHEAYRTVVATAQLIEQCWPAILATSSTFLYAALDAEFHRGLIRTFQRFTQLAGILRLSTPRDAFMTTLAKAAIPQSVLSSDPTSSPIVSTEGSRLGLNIVGLPSVDSLFSPTSVDSSSRPRPTSVELFRPTLTQRNLMCLRALVNLATALGPFLGSAWSIIMDTLQKADRLFPFPPDTSDSRYNQPSNYSGGRTTKELPSAQASVTSEFNAVEAAVVRLFNSTRDYPNESFITLLEALCGCLTLEEEHRSSQNVSSPSLIQRRTPNMSGMTTPAMASSQKYCFTLVKLGDIAKLNLHRLAVDANEGGWDLVMNQLHNVVTSSCYENPVRLMAADVLSGVAVEVAISAAGVMVELRGGIQQRCLRALEKEVEFVQKSVLANNQLRNSLEMDIHMSVLESLRTILEQCGDTLVGGWDTIFSILNSIYQPIRRNDFVQEQNTVLKEHHVLYLQSTVSPKLVRSGFNSVQLICSDFLSSIPRKCLRMLVDILKCFCVQTEDVNISLTTIALFWNVSDFARKNILHFHLDELQQISCVEAPTNEMLRDAADEGSMTALWMIIQQCLASMCDDARSDVRNGILHTVFRVFTDCDEKLSSTVWLYCIESVLCGMMHINIHHIMSSSTHQVSTDTDMARSLIASSEIIVRGFAQLISRHLNLVLSRDCFANIWTEFLQYLDSYLDFGLPKTRQFVFEALNLILDAMESCGNIKSEFVYQVSLLWNNYMPEAFSHTDEEAFDNENALLAYVKTSRRIILLTEIRPETRQVRLIMRNLRQCLSSAIATPYSSDVDRTTQLQLEILQCVELLHNDLPDVSSFLISQVAELTLLPYSTSTGAPERRSPSFVAFAKLAMELLTRLVSTYIHVREIFSCAAVSSALAALSDSIALKYTWKLQGREPSLWQSATSTTLAVLEYIVPSLEVHGLEEDKLMRMWSEIVKSADAIASTDPSSALPNAELLKDETFDVTAIRTIHRLITKPLANVLIPSSIRYKYVAGLFRASLIHPRDAISISNESSPLKDFQFNVLRVGRTFDVPFTPRVRISYECLDELFSLVAGRVAVREGDERNDNSVQGDLSTLESAAVPYLILRCSLPLKTYLADQPLRGRLPTPMSQRLELLHVLKQVAKLECSTSAASVLSALSHRYSTDGDFPAFATLNIKRKHLDWLAPLVHRALGEARLDEELSQAMRRVLDLVIEGRL